MRHVRELSIANLWLKMAALSLHFSPIDLVVLLCHRNDTYKFLESLPPSRPSIDNLRHGYGSRVVFFHSEIT